MIRTPVQPSNIKSIGHDPRTNQLEVEFGSGRVYSYDNVNVDEYNALVNAKSVGSHFATLIKPVKPGSIVNVDPITGGDSNG